MVVEVLILKGFAVPGFAIDGEAVVAVEMQSAGFWIEGSLRNRRGGLGRFVGWWRSGRRGLGCGHGLSLAGGRGGLGGRGIGLLFGRGRGRGGDGWRCARCDNGGHRRR